MTKIMSTGEVKKSDRAQKERIALRVQLIRRRWTYRDLAQRVKCHPGYIANLFCGDNPFWPIRAKINRVLGGDIFKKPTKFSVHRRCRKCTRACTKGTLGATPPVN